MAKKKKTIDFSTQNISYMDKEVKVKIMSLNLNSMDVEVLLIEDEKKKVKKIPFAHLPKPIKKVLRPI